MDLEVGRGSASTDGAQRSADVSGGNGKETKLPITAKRVEELKQKAATVVAGYTHHRAGADTVAVCRALLTKIMQLGRDLSKDEEDSAIDELARRRFTGQLNEAGQ